MTGKPQAAQGSDCPLWKKDVSKVCHKCPWYVLLRGTNPNTGNPIDDWACSIAWMPILQVEVAQKTNSVGAAVESFRNEVKSQNDLNDLLTPEVRKEIGNAIR